MEITPVGYILIPVGLIAAVLASRRTFLYLLIFFAPFTATSVINFSDPRFGIQPAYFFGLLFMTRFVVDSAMSKLPFYFRQVQDQALWPFWVFAIILLVSILVIPAYSPVEVKRPSGEMELLSLSRENFTQFMYIAYVIALTTTIGLSRLRPEEVNRALKVFIFSALFVALWGWFQVSTHYLGYSYPDFVFNNSASYSQKFEQFMANVGVKRMNSVAPEPSMLARFLLIPTFITLYCAYTKEFLFRQNYAILLATFFSFTLLSTTSATGVVGLAGGLLIFFFFTVLSARRWQLNEKITVLNRNRKAVLSVLLMLLLIVVSSLGFLKWKFGFGIEKMSSLLDIIIFEKLESQSGQNRLAHGLPKGL